MERIFMTSVILQSQFRGGVTHGRALACLMAGLPSQTSAGGIWEPCMSMAPLLYTQSDAAAPLSSQDEVFLEESLELKAEYCRRYNADLLVMGDDHLNKFDAMLAGVCPCLYLPRTSGTSSTDIKQAIQSGVAGGKSNGMAAESPHPAGLSVHHFLNLANLFTLGNLVSGVCSLIYFPARPNPMLVSAGLLCDLIEGPSAASNLRTSNLCVLSLAISHEVHHSLYARSLVCSPVLALQDLLPVILTRKAPWGQSSMTSPASTVPWACSACSASSSNGSQWSRRHQDGCTSRASALRTPPSWCTRSASWAPSRKFGASSSSYFWQSPSSTATCAIPSTCTRSGTWMQP